MSPTKILADQTASVLRLFGDDLSRADADRLLSMYTPWLRMHATSVEAADELRSLVLDRFPGDPEPVPGLDYLAQAETDADKIMANVLPESDWSLYGECGVCAVPVGARCVRVHVRPGSFRHTVHRGRPLAEVVSQPTAEAGA